MATVPLIVGGSFMVGEVDFSDAITKVTLQATADEIEIPATLATPKTSRKGGVKYELVIEYLSNDTSLTAELFSVLWTALTTTDGELAFTLMERDGSVGAANPSWSGTFIALGAAVGGDADGLSTDSQTFPLTGAPVRADA